ncbi:MAG: hypothetical protein K940chlam3_01255, partial [Chlamydiae bacterium]|nr:hypothetical protein [Chlamydiota bacterium]
MNPIKHKSDHQKACDYHEHHMKREYEIQNQLAEVRNALTLAAESRDLNAMITRIQEIRQMDKEERTWIQKQIEDNEDKCCGLAGAKSSNAFGCILRVIGIFGVTSSIIQLALDNFEVFGDDEDEPEIWLTSFFTVSTMFFVGVLGIAEIIMCTGNRALHKVMRFQELTWKEKRELKAFTKFLKELEKLNTAKNTEKANEKFADLRERVEALPLNLEGVQVFKSKEEILSFLLLSLPAYHPIRNKLKQVENFITKRPKAPDEFEEPTLVPESSTPLPEPDIETIPDSIEGHIDSSFFRNHCIDCINNGQSFEGGLKGISNVEHLT